MGALLSYLWPRVNDVEVDPATGLSPRDKHLVASTWDLVKKDKHSNGAYVFELLFTKHPDVKNMFPFARGREWAEFREDARLRIHIIAVMDALTAFVDLLDNVPLLDAMARKLADSHVKRQVSEAHFQALGEILMQALKDKLGPKLMTPETVTAWSRTYGLVLKVVGDQMNKDKS